MKSFDTSSCFAVDKRSKATVDHCGGEDEMYVVVTCASGGYHYQLGCLGVLQQYQWFLVGLSLAFT